MSRTIATILTLSDRMSGGIIRASGNVTNMTRQMRTATNQAGKMATDFKNGVDKMANRMLKFGLMAGIGGAALVFKVGLDGLKELDEASAKVKSIAFEALKLQDIKDGLLKTSNKTGIGVTELGDTQYNAISSGVSPADSLGAAVVSAKLAKAGFTDSNSALKVLMATMNVYGLTGTKAMQSISDKMMVVQNLGVITVAEMAESMGSVTPIAQAAGASIDELDAGMIALTKNGIKADEASVELKGIFTSILSPTAEAAKAAENLGIDFNASALKAKGFAGFMADVKAKTGGSTEKIASLFGNVRALTGAIVLSGVGFKDFNNGLGELKNSAGMTDKAFEIMNNTIGAKWTKLKNQFKNSCTSIVDTQSGALGTLADKGIKWLTDNQTNIQTWTNNIGLAVTDGIAYLKQIVDFLILHKDAVINFAMGFASFAIAIKIVTALQIAFDFLKLSILLTSGALTVTPFGWALIVITALVLGAMLLYQNFDTVKQVLSDIGVAIKNEFVRELNVAIDTINSLIRILNKIPGVNIGEIKKTMTKDTSVDVRKAEKAGYSDAGIKVDGSHANGLNYVPKNGYIAELHKGERVQKANENPFNKSKSSSIGGNTFIINFNGNVGTEEFFDQAGEHIITKIKGALNNI